MFDAARFHELAGFFEYDEGMTRFQAEERAAARLNVNRWEAINAIRKRDSQGGGNIRQASARQSTDDLSRLQSGQAKEDRPVPVGDVPAGRDRVELLALSVSGRGVLR